MIDWNLAWTILGPALGAIGATLLIGRRTRIQKTVAARVAQAQFPMELAQELRKARGAGRQELRFESYGTLWVELRALAIYDTAALDRKTAQELSTALTKWYFTKTGGLLLTPHARDFYFSLQDLLRLVGNFPQDWEVERTHASQGSEEAQLRALLARLGTSEAKAVLRGLDCLEDGVLTKWETEAGPLAKHWRAAIAQLGARWGDLSDQERFVTIQQAGSILRTSLCCDVESRLR